MIQGYFVQFELTSSHIFKQHKELIYFQEFQYLAQPFIKFRIIRKAIILQTLHQTAVHLQSNTCCLMPTFFSALHFLSDSNPSPTGTLDIDNLAIPVLSLSCTHILYSHLLISNFPLTYQRAIRKILPNHFWLLFH